MVKLLSSPIVQLVLVIVAVMSYFELRLTDTVPDEPIGWGLCFASAVAIVRLTPLACEEYIKWRKKV